MRTISIICFIVCVSTVLFGQGGGQIRGVVTDTNGPVAGVSVTATASGNDRRTLTATTNSAGEFLFERVLPGEYSIRASISINGGTWSSEPVDPVQITDGRSFTVDLTLRSIPIIRESVTVAAGETQTVERVSKTIDVIDGQEMRDRADFALVESLRTIPGFRVQQLGGFGRSASIKTRGLRNQDTAILLDGIRFRDPAAITGDASPFLSDITLTSVSRIEVLRGSGSSLYGTNAIGGVVDFKTPRTAAGTHGQLSGAYGGYGLGRFRGNISHGLDNGKFGIGAGVSRTSYTRGIDGNDDANNTNLQARIDAKPFAKTTISSRLFVSNADVRLNSNPDTLGSLPSSNVTIINARQGINFVTDLDDPDDLQRSRFTDLQFVVEQRLTESLVINGFYKLLYSRRRNDNGPLGVGFQSASTSIFEGSVHTANINFKWSPSHENMISAGYEYEGETYGNDGLTPDNSGNFFTRAGQRSSTFFVQDLVSLLDGDLQLAGGFRVQRFDLERPEFSLTNAPYEGLTLSNPPTSYTVDGAISYYFQRSGTKFRAHVGNGYRVPSLYERFGTFYSTFGPPSFIAIGDPYLKPERSVAFDAGVEQDIAKRRLRLSATYFYTRLIDIIGYGNVVPDIGSTPRPFGGYENQKGGIARGGEFSLKAEPGQATDLFASYTFTNSDQFTPQVSGSGILRSLGIPNHQFTLVATQRFKRFWINFDLLATSSYLAPIFSNSTFESYVYRFSGNRKGDVTAGYSFGLGRDRLSLRVYGTIENVFGHEYFENGFRTFGRNGRIGTTLVF